ncbi:FYVE zinc finger-domain-containing protein [Vararia minispora EC-137]|uniref:FYVE zinc finger-domain-containing protein n=1 Tax=Vararia minispora EC-137 TaxID=1314806 RepID=A0ACB8QWA8_9AGAM|nr:FYVE zinc finger-domain-containing protein [Vararia minispora EC-137]
MFPGAALTVLGQSKRHSRTPSNPQRTSVASASPSPPRPSSVVVSESHLTSAPTTPTSSFAPNGHSTPNGKHLSQGSRTSADLSDVAPWNRPKPVLSPAPYSPTVLSIPPSPLSPRDGAAPAVTVSPLPKVNGGSLLPSPLPPSPTYPLPTPAPHVNGNGHASPAAKSTALLSKPTESQPEASSSKAPAPAARRASTFRHVPLRNSSAPVSPSPLRPSTHTRASSLASQHLELVPQATELPRSRMSSYFGPNAPSFPSSQSPSPDTAQQPPPPSNGLPSAPILPTLPEVAQPVARAASKPLPKSPIHTPSLSLSPAGSPQPRASPAVRTYAPYRPGFQPRGVCNPRTDEFLELRKARRDVGRVERTRLERRLEKLINLHFGSESDEKASLRQRQSRRMSSLFDLDFKSVDAGDLWRNMMQREPAPGSKTDIRAMEQTITPWVKDADVSQCPLCSASFHPITNRKHHCRLCGNIICSLPVKRPQRPAPCSILFVADPKTGKIEEVGEGVDYGVRKRTMSTASARGAADEPTPDEKFLKGVRVCRECRPILLRQQHAQEVAQTPTFSRLYAVFVELEREIEDALPQFQELLLSLNNDERPTHEASAARRRLVEAFAQYDAVAKRIRKLPTPGPGSSQERVQAAILARANVFLQKNMVPLQVRSPLLQAIPTPKTVKSPDEPPADSTSPHPVIDPDSAAAHALQPLLEQEALLETFVQEAKAHRKFEDVRTLKANLAEIRSEIDKIMANVQAGTTEVGSG